jgi:hypothetical protein
MTEGSERRASVAAFPKLYPIRIKPPAVRSGLSAGDIPGFDEMLEKPRHLKGKTVLESFTTGVQVG